MGFTTPKHTALRLRALPGRMAGDAARGKELYDGCAARPLRGLRAPTAVLYEACERNTSRTAPSSHVTVKKPLPSSKAVTTPLKPVHCT